MFPWAQRIATTSPSSILSCDTRSLLTNVLEQPVSKTTDFTGTLQLSQKHATFVNIQLVLFGLLSYLCNPLDVPYKALPHEGSWQQDVLFAGN